MSVSILVLLQNLPLLRSLIIMIVSGVYHNHVYLAMIVLCELLESISRYRFPPSEHPVLAFRGAPASFPLQPQHVPLQKYLRWSDWIEKTATDYVIGNLRPGKFVGIHLRNEQAWVRFKISFLLCCNSNVNMTVVLLWATYDIKCINALCIEVS